MHSRPTIVDIDDGCPGDGHFGNARLNVRGDDGTPVFVGVARTRDVDAYLGRTAHATLTDFDVDPFEPPSTARSAAAPARPRPRR